MINKETAGLLYSYNYKIVDKEGNVWDIEGIAKRGKSFRIDIYCNEKLNSWHAKPEDIGVKYWILARELDLTKEITVDGETFNPLKRLLWEYNFNTDIMQESEILEYAESMVEIDMSATVSKFLSKWQYSHDLPVGSWKHLND